MRYQAFQVSVLTLFNFASGILSVRQQNEPELEEAADLDIIEANTS